MHIQIETKRFDATPPEWLKIGSECGELANQWSDRGDIIAYIGEGAGAGIAAALWNPVLAEMELNVPAAFGEGAKPEFIGDLTDRSVQFEQPVACGAILHEAMHARHSKYDFSEVRKYKDRRISELVELFEELRIETRGVEHWPRNRSFLRACALGLVIADMEGAGKEAETAQAMVLSRLILLALGRVTAGVLDEDDVQPVRDAALRVLGEDLLGRLQGLWTAACRHRDDEDWAPLRVLAERWVELLEEAGFKTEPSEEEKRAAREMAEAIGEIMKKMDEMAADTETRARGEASDQSGFEEDERAVEKAAESEKESAAAEEEAGKIFSKGTMELPKSGTKSRLIEERMPKDAERAAAVKVAQMLERAKYRDRVVAKRTTAEPPGRLRSRAMVQASADRSRGVLASSVQPWTSHRRYHIEDPDLRIGILTDISGSMSSAMEPMAVTNWLLSEAGRRIQAQVASVYFGNSVFPGLSPGEHLDKVKVYSAPDGTEKFNSAFKAINGKLGLLHSSGARLLVVVSDLHHTALEREAERKWFGRCAQEGVAVIVMPFSPYGVFIDSICEGLPVRVLTHVADPVMAAMEIGHAAAEALTQAGNRA